jgi:hypothetical protein
MSLDVHAGRFAPAVVALLKLVLVRHFRVPNGRRRVACGVTERRLGPNLALVIIHSHHPKPRLTYHSEIFFFRVFPHKTDRFSRTVVSKVAATWQANKEQANPKIVKATVSIFLLHSHSHSFPHSTHTNNGCEAARTSANARSKPAPHGLPSLKRARINPPASIDRRKITLTLQA